MYGRSVNTLTLQLWGPKPTGSGSQKKVTIWDMQGSHGDKWVKAAVDLGGFANSFARQVSHEVGGGGEEGRR